MAQSTDVDKDKDVATIRGHVFLKAVACLNCDNTSTM